MTNGNGAGTDLQGALAQMWRDVYAKAAGVAEQRTQELLKYHVYVYPHGAGGGAAGGGGWVLLDEQEVTAPAGALSLRLPASGGVDASYDTLVLELRARSTYTGTSREYVTLTVNDETPVFYASTITRNDVGTLSGFASGTDNNWDVGPCPKATAPAGMFGSSVVQLPMYARTDAFKTHLGHAVASTNTSGGNAYSQFSAGWLYSSSSPALAQAAITSVQARLAWGNLAQGSLARLWGVKDAGAGGGGTGGGGWSLVEKVTVASPTARVTFSSVPAAGDCLMLVSRGSVTDPAGGNGAYYGLSLNGDPYPGTVDKYNYVMSDVAGVPGAVAPHNTTGRDRFAYIGLMGASLSGSTTNDGGGVSITYLPDFTAAERLNVISDFQTYHTTLYAYGTARVVGGRYSTVYDAHGPLTALAVQCGNSLQFDAGSTFALYVLNGTGGGGGGGGGTTDVTITTNASLTSTESPANTFALAARISADSGNALSLHANGLYSTDTAGGGGADATYVHVQSAASATWTVAHNLGKYPSVSVVDSGGTTVIPDVHYDSPAAVTLTFGAPTSGQVFCN